MAYKTEKLSAAMEDKQDVVDYVAGLRKTGPNQYTVITGKIVNGVGDVKVDHVHQSLEYSAEGLKVALRNLLGSMP